MNIKLIDLRIIILCISVTCNKVLLTIKNIHGHRNINPAAIIYSDLLSVSLNSVVY